MAVDPNLPVLVVDDCKTMIRIIRNLLKQLGFSSGRRQRGTRYDAAEAIRPRDLGWNMER